MQDEPVNPMDPLGEGAARAFEQSLAQLRPAGPEAGRDNLMFAAGAHAAKKLHAWQGVSGLLATGWIITIVVWPAVLGVYGRGPDRNTNNGRSPAPLVAHHAPSSVPAAQFTNNEMSESTQAAFLTTRTPAAETYLDLRQAVLAQGLDAIPAPRGSTGAPAHDDDASLRNLQHLLTQPKGNAL